MSISDRLDQIAARCESAYPAPWHRRGDDEYGWMVHGPERESFIPGVMQATQVAGVDRGPDAEFIAASRTDVPELVAALRAVLDVCDGLEEAHRADPEHMYELGMEEAAHRVRYSITTALGEARHDQ